MLARPAKRLLLSGNGLASHQCASSQLRLTSTATSSTLFSSSLASLLLPSRSRSYATATPPHAATPPPRPGDGPLMERRADRELPDIGRIRFRWSRTLPWFLLIVAGSSVAIFNYQKSSSPVVASTMYALRTSPRARAYLGDEIYFEQRVPWIAGEMNQLQGRINVHFMVRGTRNAARMRFTSHRPTPRGVFETLEWSLETADGRKIDLLEDVPAGQDPFRGIQLLPDDYVDYADENESYTSRTTEAGMPEKQTKDDTRGFRQPTRR